MLYKNYQIIFSNETVKTEFGFFMGCASGAATILYKNTSIHLV